MFGWRFRLGLLSLAIYSALSHVLMAQAPDRPGTILALFGPWLLAAAVVGWRRHHLPTLILTGLGSMGMALISLWGGFAGAGANRLYLLQHAGMYIALFGGFVVTLKSGATPLISAVALRVHGTLTPEMQRYTCRLTQVWAAYFFSMAVLAFVLYPTVSWTAWSFFANILTPLTALGLFVGEYLLRYVLHPEFERATLADAIRAYRHCANPAAREGQVL